MKRSRENGFISTDRELKRTELFVLISCFSLVAAFVLRRGAELTMVLKKKTNFSYSNEGHTHTHGG